MKNTNLRFLVFLFFCGLSAAAGMYWAAIGLTGWGIGACIGWLSGARTGMIVGSIVGLALALGLAIGWPHGRRGRAALVRRLWVAVASGLVFGNIVSASLNVHSGVGTALVAMLVLFFSHATEIRDPLLFGFKDGYGRGPRFSRRAIAAGVAAGVLGGALGWLLGGNITDWCFAGAVGGLVVALLLASSDGDSLIGSPRTTNVVRFILLIEEATIAGVVAASVGTAFKARSAEVEVPNLLERWFGQNQALAAAVSAARPSLFLFVLAIVGVVYLRFQRPRPGTRGERVLFGHTESVSSVAITPDGSYAVSGSDDGTVRIWDLATSAETCSLEHNGTIKSLAVSPDGKRAATLDGGWPSKTRLWNLPDGTLRCEFVIDEQSDTPDALAFGAESLCLFVGMSNNGVIAIHRRNIEDKHDPMGVAIQVEGDGEGDKLRSLSVSSDGKILLVVHSSGLVQAWDLEEDYEAWRFRSDEEVIRYATLLPLGNGVIASDDAGNLHIWNARSGTETKWWSGGVEDKTVRISAIALFPDGERAVSGDDAGRLRVWELKAEQPEHTSLAELHLGGGIKSLGVVPNTKEVIAGMEDGTVRIWNPLRKSERERTDRPS